MSQYDFPEFEKDGILPPMYNENLKMFRSEQEAIAEMTARFEHRVRNFFNPIIEDYLSAGNVKGAQRVIGSMPDSVSKVFAMDRLRQYQLHGK